MLFKLKILSQIVPVFDSQCDANKYFLYKIAFKGGGIMYFQGT